LKVWTFWLGYIIRVNTSGLDLGAEVDLDEGKVLGVLLWAETELEGE